MQFYKQLTLKCLIDTYDIHLTALMLQFPGEGTALLLRDGVPVYREVLPEIGNLVVCKVVKLVPNVANLLVTHIEGEKCNVEYKALLRAQDVQICVAEGQFLWDKIEKDATINAKIVSYGDTNGMFVSLNL